MRGGSSLHCSRWNPNAIHKGASIIRRVSTTTYTPCTRARATYTDIQTRPSRDRVYPDVWCGGAFHRVRSLYLHGGQLCRHGNKSSNLPQNCKVGRKICKDTERTAARRVPRQKMSWKEKQPRMFREFGKDTDKFVAQRCLGIAKCLNFNICLS